MPTLTRDHLTTYAAPDVDPPFERSQPEPDAWYLAECEAEGYDRGYADYAYGNRQNQYPLRDVYNDARRDGWRRGYDAAENAEWEASPVTLTWAEFENARK